jgi:predicted RND superfamily exporter protein
MDRFGRFIVNHRIMVLIVSAILILPSLLGIAFTKSNYDILSYMPGELNSRQGEELLKEKFGVSGLGFIMVSNREKWEIMELKRKIGDIPGVESVLWIDDLEDITIPEQFMNSEVRERFLHGDSTFLQVHFGGNSRSAETAEAVKAIWEVIGEDALFGGEPVIIGDLQQTTSREMLYYMIIAFVLISLVLSASMTSFIEPLLFFLSIGVAIILNMGSNIIKGEISFVTSSIAAVMQLGISMDYSIFLLHRFEEEKQKHNDIRDAMVAALSRTGVPVVASALTTIAGFIALMFMKNGLGRDLGFVLAKGIVLSLVVTVTVLPCLILIFNKYADRHRHKPIIPTLRKASGWITRFRWVFLAVIIIFVVPSFLAQRNLEYYYSTEHYLPESSRSVEDTRKISGILGGSEYAYVITPDEGTVKEKQLIERIKSIQAVDSIIALSEQVDSAIPEIFIPGEVKETYRKEGYRYFQVFLSTPADDPRTFDAVDEVREEASKIFEEYYVTGSPALTRDLASLQDPDTKIVAIISIGLILLIIALSFKSLSIPFLLVLSIEFAVWINLCIPYLQGTAVSSVTSIIIGAIQLGATVDYAILFTSRYRENLATAASSLEAVRQTITDTGRSIMTSALTVISATIGISFIAGIKATRELTLMIGRGAAISVAVIFLGLPSMFLVFERLINRTTIGGFGIRPLNACKNSSLKRGRFIRTHERG